MTGREVLGNEVASFLIRWPNFQNISILVDMMVDFQKSLYNQKECPLF
jgi:hypothetical protein